jgi:DNA polymerase III sliding clamp (beta) subunit (PCNA family)
VIAAIAGRETITLTANREAAEIILGSARYSVPTREKQRHQATVASGRLRTIIRSARGSLADPTAAARSHSSSDPAHPVHHGALLISDEEQTRLIATDSYRLIAHPLPGARGKFEINLPARELAEAIASDSERTEVTVAINQQETVAQINCAGETWTVHLITEPFGSWQAILAPVPDAVATVTVARESLLAAASGAVSAADRACAVNLLAGEDSLRVSVNAAFSEDGEAFADNLPATLTPSTGQATIRFNPKFLLDAVAALDGDRVELTVGDPKHRAELKGAQVRVMVMPAPARWR